MAKLSLAPLTRTRTISSKDEQVFRKDQARVRFSHGAPYDTTKEGL